MTGSYQKTTTDGMPFSCGLLSVVLHGQSSFRIDVNTRMSGGWEAYNVLQGAYSIVQREIPVTNKTNVCIGEGCIPDGPPAVSSGYRTVYSLIQAPFSFDSFNRSHGPSADFIDPLPPPPPDDCDASLRNAGKDRAGLDRAKANWDALSAAAGGDPDLAGVLAALGIKETNFRNISQMGGGLGRGVFQIDIGQNPDVSEENATDVGWAAKWASNYLVQQYDRAIALGNTPGIAMGAAVHAYNSGSLIWRDRKSVDHAKKQLQDANQMQSLELLNRGTYDGHYVTDVLNIYTACF